MTQTKTLNNLLKKIYEWLIYAFIIISPFYKCFDSFSILGYNPIVLIITLICFCGLIIGITRSEIGKKREYLASLILCVFVLQLFLDIIKGNKPEIGIVLCMFIYICWLKLDYKSIDFTICI